MIESESFAYQFHRYDAISSHNGQIYKLDLGEYRRCLHEYNSIRQLKTLLEDRCLAAGGGRGAGNENNVLWQHAMYHVVRKVDRLYLELDDLRKRVQKEWLAQ